MGSICLRAQSPYRGHDVTALVPLLIAFVTKFSDDGSVVIEEKQGRVGDPSAAFMKNSVSLHGGAVGVGEERVFDPFLFPELLQNLNRIVTDRHQFNSRSPYVFQIGLQFN